MAVPSTHRPSVEVGAGIPIAPVVADMACMQGREVRVVNTTIAGQIGAVLKAVILAVAAVAITAMVTAASIFAMISLAGINPLTLIGTILLGFAAIRATVDAVAVPLLRSSAASWDRAFGI